VSNILVEPPEQPRHDQRAKSEKCYVDNVNVCSKNVLFFFFYLAVTTRCLAWLYLDNKN